MAVSLTTTSLVTSLTQSRLTTQGQASDASGQSPTQSRETKSKSAATARELSQAQQREIDRLKETDRLVREHADAHLVAGQGVVLSGPRYSYTYGPDGRQYASGGDVTFDTSREQKPEANIDKGQRLQTAALAPAQPTPEDFQVAAVGKDLETSGRQDLASRQAEEARQQQTKAAEGRREEAVKPRDISTRNPLSPDQPVTTTPEQTQQLEARKLSVTKAYQPYGSNSPARISVLA